ncbi:GntR family transcriptional regulator [Bradyrhizobium sp.]|uniref:GntR family transcriptional regulator n=1 Tax=Bradyrhizobium sp. TaxID=376 RepID=UPI0039E5B751
MDLRVSRKTVQQGTFEKLKDAIMAGVFQPGDRLVETDLCEQLGVSRASLREALRSLQSERLIDFIPNRGPQIPVLSWKEAEDIYELRALLEGEAAARCATAISDEDIQSLSVTVQTLRRVVKTNDAADKLKCATNFYEVLLRNCGNEIIKQTLHGLHARINFLRARSMSLSGRTKASYEEMNALYLAIKDRDPKAARKIAQLHVQNAREAAREAFKENQPDNQA